MFAKQSTTLMLRVGPILDEDGLPYVTATIANTAFLVSQNGTAGANPDEAAGAVQDGNQGMYLLSLDATDTNTLGMLDVSLELDGYAMAPVRMMILPAATYDAMIANEAGTAGGIPLSDASGRVKATDGNGNALAPAATALTSATWTDAKAGYLDAAVTLLGSPMQTGESVTVGTNNDKSGYSIDGASGGVGPTASEATRDIYVTAFKNGTASLYARVYKDGVDIQRANASTITYSVYLLDGGDPDARTAVADHDEVSLTVADVIFDTLQSDLEASNYNFKHTIPIGEHPAFTIAGRNYLAEYVITPTAGEKIIVRFRIEVL